MRICILLFAVKSNYYLRGQFLGSIQRGAVSNFQTGRCEKVDSTENTSSRRVPWCPLLHRQDRDSLADMCDFSKNLIRTPPGHFKQVSKCFRGAGDLVVLSDFLT